MSGLEGMLSASVWSVPVFLVLALGMYVSLRVCNFPDLTVDGSFAIGSCALYLGTHAFSSALVGLLFAITLGAGAGALTGGLYSIRPKPLYKLLAGLLVMFSLQGVTFRRLGTAESKSRARAPPILNDLRHWEMALPMGLRTWRPLSLVLCLALAVICMVILYRFLISRKGVLLRTAGHRSEVLVAFGLSPRRKLVFGLMLANALVATSGWLFSLMNSTATYEASGMIIDAIAIVLLGEAMLSRKFVDQLFNPRGALIACLAGAVAYGFITGMATFLLSKAFEGSFLPQDHGAVVSVVIIATVFFVSQQPETEEDLDSEPLL